MFGSIKNRNEKKNWGQISIILSSDTHLGGWVGGWGVNVDSWKLAQKIGMHNVDNKILH